MPDDTENANSNEGADPSLDIKKQNPGETTTTDQVSEDDRNKTQKLAKAGEPAVDPNAENPT